MGMRCLCLCVVSFTVCLANASAPRSSSTEMRATAYSLHGRTATGTKPHRGIVAADPRVLPPGSKVQIKHAGPYSGTYKVGDTGGSVHGRNIDIYTPSEHAARQFGARNVQVKVLNRAARR
jgi:3D (Asp-Asp-Asp) domain-containing protein